MNLIYPILFISSAAITFTETSGFMQWFKWKIKVKRLKPFDCEKCMAFWTGGIYGYLHFDNTFSIFGFACLCSVASILILKLIQR